MTEKIHIRQLKNVMGQVPSLPAATSELSGIAYQYMGETNNTYQHGYIYECKGTPVYSSIIYFEPHKVIFDTDVGDLIHFFEDNNVQNYLNITHGTMTYYSDADIWALEGLDAEDNVVFTGLQLYTQDLIDYGFVFINPMSDYADGEVITFETTFTETFIYGWERVDVQPGGSRGRFLALWNCATGLAESDPPISPYEYKTGDYFIVGTISTATPAVNYKPDGTSYVIGTASTAVETNEVAIDDTYFFDGTQWKLQSNSNKTVSFSAIAGDIYDNNSATTALNAKANKTTVDNHIADTNNPHSVTKAQVGLGNVDNTSDANKPISTATQTALDGKIDKNAAITGATHTKITYDNKGLITGGSDITLSDVTDITATASEVNVLDGITATTTELNYTDGVTSNIQTQLDSKQATISDLSTIRSNAAAGKSASDTIATYGDIVTHNVSEFATSAQGTKADSALQPGDNISELVNDAGYLTQHQSLSDLGITATAAELNVLDGITATTAELNYTDGVTSNIQTQLNAKQATISDLATIRSNATAGAGAASTIAGYGNIVTHNTSEFATSAQGAKADTALQSGDNISELVNDAGYQTSSDVSGSISTHNSDAAAHSTIITPITTSISTIQGKIPAQASSTNQLADKAFVNSSIATSTATFKGTYNTLAELEAVTADDNDYGFVISTDTAGNTVYNRYKYNGSVWLFEYALNNSSFTATQWAAINSGATSTNIGQIATNTSNISAHTSNTSNPHSVTKAQVGLGNVDNTSDLNKPISTATQAALDLKANSADLATVATTGSYNNLSDKPTIGNATLTIQKNGTDIDTFTANATTDKSINIVVPTKTSDLSNDDGFITGITSSMVTNALGYTPYNSTNPSGYQANVLESVKVNGTALIITSKSVDVPVPTKVSDLTNDTGYITGITYSMVTTALGFVPYNSTNPNGYQANVIETVKVNGTALTITSKAVDVPVPTKVSDLTNDSGFITKSVNDLTNYTLSANLASVATTGTLASLTDVNTTGATSGQFLMWNGTAWVPQSSSSTVAWGAITGTLSDQSDISNALNAKQDSSTAVTHTANTQVGDTSTPVYIAADGTAKACATDFDMGSITGVLDNWYDMGTIN